MKGWWQVCRTGWVHTRARLAVPDWLRAWNGHGCRAWLPGKLERNPALLFPAPALQGLADGPYYFVMWAWHLLLYCAFVAVFCIFGGLIGLKVGACLGMGSGCRHRQAAWLGSRRQLAGGSCNKCSLGGWAARRQLRQRS